MAEKQSVFEEKGLKFETFEWGGQTRYRCPFKGCFWDSYSELEVVKHWNEVHRPDIEPSKNAPLLFGSDGRPLFRG